jgi:membrane dipeptidase
MEPPLHTDHPAPASRVASERSSGPCTSRSDKYGGTPGDASRVMTQMDVVRRLVERYPDDLALAYTAADVRAPMRGARLRR